MSLAGFVDFAQRIADGPYFYDTGPGRCDPLASGYADCSGLVVAALRSQGVAIDCTGSFALARTCHAAGSGIPLWTARSTRGALLWLGINEGQGGIPGVDPGHVAISRGDGTTVEARNHRAGILVGPFDGRGWDWAGMPAWLTVTPPGPPPPPPPPVPKPEETMLIVNCPGKPAALLIGGAVRHFGLPTTLHALIDAGVPSITVTDPKEYDRLTGS